jgi:hypothetical protein
VLARFLTLLWLIFAPFAFAAGEVEILAPLVTPQKVDALEGARAANPRLRKILYWLEMARRSGQEPSGVIYRAQQKAGYAETPRAEVEKAALLRNLTILERLGCLTDDGMAKLRKGNAPTITRGPYAGDVVEVDHIIPRAVVPELDCKLYNLEFMPARMNREKSAKIGQRQIALAKQWNAQGLLTETGFQAVTGAVIRPRKSALTGANS